MVLDDWEQKCIYDAELANTIGGSAKRAREIRGAHDAQWQTLNPGSIAQSAITPAEQQAFNVFHGARRNMYCCVLPGEVIYECVTRLQQGAIQLSQIPAIHHLIVDEYQDLNACDQEFIRLLIQGGAKLFIAGDDDQSIYSFRHANPAGIVQFDTTYPQSHTHNLSSCFRCTPAVLSAAQALINHNPARLPKQLHSLYASAAPVIHGSVRIWSFQIEQAEITALAESCQRLIQGGMAGQEDQIMILISNRRLQIQPITQALGNLGLPYDPPGGEALRDEDTIRAAFSILRIVRDRAADAPDYVAFRALIGRLSGVGIATARTLGDQCIANNQNYRELFYLPANPNWLSNRPATAVDRVRTIVQQTNAWSLDDTIQGRAQTVAALLDGVVFSGAGPQAQHSAIWNSFVGTLPDGMTLAETLGFLGATDDAEQRRVMDAVLDRLGQQPQQPAVATRRIRILTMHGAKGLTGKVVFIPSVEQGILPNFKAIQAAGLLIEQRRLFYVSLTRAKACCVISHCASHGPPASFVLAQQPVAHLPRSQFLQEIGIPSNNRAGGLSANEVAQIMDDIQNL